MPTNQKADVDDAVADIVRDPTIGEAKKGDLAGMFVHKFKCNGQPNLLAYECVQTPAVAVTRFT